MCSQWGEAYKSLPLDCVRHPILLEMRDPHLWCMSTSSNQKKRAHKAWGNTRLAHYCLSSRNSDLQEIGMWFLLVFDQRRPSCELLRIWRWWNWDGHSLPITKKWKIGSCGPSGHNVRGGKPSCMRPIKVGLKHPLLCRTLWNMSFIHFTSVVLWHKVLTPPNTFKFHSLLENILASIELFV